MKYKALYEKMMDDLKDASMWLDRAKMLKTKEDPTDQEIAHFLYESAKERVMDHYPRTMEHFASLCQADKEKYCDMIHDYMDGWYHSLVGELEKWK